MMNSPCVMLTSVIDVRDIAGFVVHLLWLVASMWLGGRRSAQRRLGSCPAVQKAAATQHLARSIRARQQVGIIA